MNIISNVSWIFFANLFVAFAKWLIVILIANFLTPNEVGIYSLAFAISAPITLFANMKLRSLYITEEKARFEEYLLGRKIVSFFAFIVLFSIALAIYPNYIFVIILVGLSKIFDLHSDMYYAIPHKNRDMKLIGGVMIYKQTLSLCAFSITLLLTKSLTISLVFQLVIQILFLYFWEIRYFKKRYSIKKNNKKLSYIDAKSVLLLGLPMGLVQMLVSLNTSIPRYFLESFGDPSTLGYFSAIAYIITIGNMMMNSISQNFIPSLTRKINKGMYGAFEKNVFVHLTLFSFILGGILIVGSFLVGEFFLGFIYGDDYRAYSDVLILMSIAMAVNFLSWNFDSALLSLRYISIQPKISVFVLFITVVSSYYFINSFGIQGAPYTLIVANSLQLLIRIYFVKKRLKKLSNL